MVESSNYACGWTVILLGQLTASVLNARSVIQPTPIVEDTSLREKPEQCSHSQVLFCQPPSTLYRDCGLATHRDKGIRCSENSRELQSARQYYDIYTDVSTSKF